MSMIAVEIVTIAALLALNGLLAMSETAIVASRRARLEHRARRGDSGARAALSLVEDPTRFLSTVQVGITLIGIFAGAFGGATIAEQLALRLETIPGLSEYREAIALTIVVVCITYLSLIIGELVPKRLAMQWPERIAMVAARPVALLAKVASPLVKVLTVSTQIVLRLFGVKKATGPVVTEDEIYSLIRQGAEAGVLEQAEQQMVKGVFRLGNATAEKLMTPRTDLTWVDLDDGPQAIRAHLVQLGQSRYLVGRGSVENVQGIVRAEDLLAQLLRDEPLDLMPVLRAPLYVPATMPALDLLDRLRQAQEQSAVVLDEFGGMSGLVTTSDLLAEILGDLRPVLGTEQPITRREDGSWLVDGTVAVEDLAEVLGEIPPLHDSYRTVGGLVMSHLGHVPAAGEHLELGGLRYEVVDMDGRRVDKVLITRLAPRSAPGNVR